MNLTNHDCQLLRLLSQRISDLQDYVDHLRGELSDKFFESDVDLVHFSNDLGILHDQIGDLLEP